MYFDLVSKSFMFSDTEPVTSAACESPHKTSAATGLFHSSYLRKSWKYFCVVRWISRLYSLQCSPWNPRVPFLRLLAHAFYLCQENMKLNVFLTIAFHLVSLTCPLSFWKIAEQRGSFQYQEVLLLRMLKSGKKKCLWVVSVGFFLLCCKSNETDTILSTKLMVSELNLWLVIFATSASSLNCGSPRSLAHGWTGRYRYITLMYLLFTLWAYIQSDIEVLCMLCICMAYLETTASGLSPVNFLTCRAHVLLGQWDVMASSPHVK